MPPPVAPSLTPTPTKTPSKTPSVTPSRSVGASPPATPSVTPSISKTPSVTPSITPSISVSTSIRPSPSVTPSVTPSPNCNQGNILQQLQLAALSMLQTAVGYYKINLSETKRNIYGESLEKWYYQPVLIRCSIERNPDTIKDEMFGPDIEKTLRLSVPKLVFSTPDPNINTNIEGIGLNFLPEIGDIIYERSLDRYFEIHNIVIDYQPYNATIGSGNLSCPPLELVTYQLECHHTRVSRLNLLPDKLL